MNMRVALLGFLFSSSFAHASWIWVEGEKPARSAVSRHPYWYDKVKHTQLSGRDFISHWDDRKAGEVVYNVSAPKAGDYDFWVRANPVQAKLSFRLNGGSWTPIKLDGEQLGSTNIAEDDKPDLRFIAWVHPGKVTLKKGINVVAFRMESENNHHGYLDCFVLSDEPFQPRGVLKPDQIARAVKQEAKANQGWIAFDPPNDPFKPNAIDLRHLNEKAAGDGGYIGVKDGQFIHSRTGNPVRFWAVNGPPGADRDTLKREARLLAKRGVNLVRIHHGYFDQDGKVKLDDVRHSIEIVEAMKAEGIYCHFSIYFPLWLTPKPNTRWLLGYDGNTHPFAALYFNKDFQDVYRSWWKALLTTPSLTTGRRLIDDPAVFGAEIINEDSYFFWTFSKDNIPDPQLRIVEKQFGAWLTTRYGSIDAAFRVWGTGPIDRDAPSEGRVGFRPLWNMANERTKRDQDAARFLAESQRTFYSDTYRFLRDLGFKGLITASNWYTASPEVLGPIERHTYTVGDFIDRHGYFGCLHHGLDTWAIKDGQTFADRSALKFDPEEPGKSRTFNHPAMDIAYNDKPSMISETTWERPNRFRSEAPLFYAAYGALQDSDAIVHFAFDGSRWTVKPGFFMQPWTVMTPAMFGQFPASALIYRLGLVATGDKLVDLNLKVDDVLNLKGTPMPQDANFDELRLKDVPKGTEIKAGHVIDPLVHFVGRTNVTYSETGGRNMLKNLNPYIDRVRKTVTSITGELKLDYGKGLLTINAPRAQAVSGMLRDAGTIDLTDLSIRSSMDLGHIVAVSLDGEPLAGSKKILLQVMSEEKNSDFRTEPAGTGVQKITSIGHDPWLIRVLDGVVKFKRTDALKMKVTALDANGDPAQVIGTAAEIKLRPSTIYYLIAL